jgi:hypothetical protein
MSALLYGRASRRRVMNRNAVTAAAAAAAAVTATSGGSQVDAQAIAQQAADAATEAADGSGDLLAKVAGLFPADLLLAYSVVLPTVTATGKDANGNDTVSITDASAFKLLLAALVVAGPILYAAGRYSKERTKWQLSDIGRALVPALAFAAWAGLEKPNAWSVFGHGSNGELLVGAVVCALIAIALSLAFPATSS